MDAGPDRVLDVRAASGPEDSGIDEVVEARLQKVQRRRLVGFQTSRVIGECERGVKEAWFGAGELEIGMADRSEPERGACRCVRPCADLAHTTDVLLRSGATGPQALRLADAILDALQDAGLDQDDAQDAYDLFLTYVLGSAGRQTTAIAPARWRAFAEALDQAEPDTYPALRRAARSGTTRDDDTRFAGGLHLVLEAIAGRASR
jgi:tetracycline repressor-like protein